MLTLPGRRRTAKGFGGSAFFAPQFPPRPKAAQALVRASRPPGRLPYAGRRAMVLPLGQERAATPGNGLRESLAFGMAPVRHGHTCVHEMAAYRRATDRRPWRGWLATLGPRFWRRACSSVARRSRRPGGGGDERAPSAAGCRARVIPTTGSAIRKLPGAPDGPGSTAAGPRPIVGPGTP